MSYRIEAFKKASFCRHFENQVYQNVQKKNIKIPVYLSAGQEYIAASISTILKEKGIEPNIFIQHRGHSTYLSFGASPVELVDELLGKKTGCAGGMGGSASIQSLEKNIFGHDGLMGSQIPIAVGSAFSSKEFTLGIMGDASAEEDYVMSAIAWAGFKKLPILFVVEDNNLSILTEKKVRRDWDMHTFAKSVSVDAYEISDDPNEIYENLLNYDYNSPRLLNINTTRLFWHSGAGIDEYERFDRYNHIKTELGSIGNEIHETTKTYLENIWKQRLETL
jgi:pyruvate dehydrogenase E1 component alpha subunit